jgi:hypothetical protein
MTSRPAVLTARRSRRLWAITGLALATAAAVVSVRPAEALADDQVPLLHESFSSTTAAAAFESGGPGTWMVKKDTYQLKPWKNVESRVPADGPLTVLRRAIGDSAWSARAAVLTQRAATADVAVVFEYDDRTNFSYVRLAADEDDSGVFQVRDSAVTELFPVSAVVEPGRWQQIEVRRSQQDLSVSVGDTVAGLRLVASGRAERRATPRLGFATSGNPVQLDDLVLSAQPGGTTQPTTPPSSTPETTTPPSPAPETPAPPSSVPANRVVRVSTSAQLTSALADARPGDLIDVADGVYTSKGLSATQSIGGKRYFGTFTLERSGTAAAPIRILGSRQAVIDGMPGGNGTATQYGLYLVGTSYVEITGLTVRNVAKGVVLDRSDHVTLAGLAVHTIGQEGIHLRASSSDNVVRDNEVHDTGLKKATFGEGIYVGSANSNWGTYSDGAPDRSDRNQLIGNRIYRTGAESMDIKEGTTGGLIRGNTFEGSTMSGSWADSWIDVKGNGWQIAGNRGMNALEDGFQVHRALTGWGNSNVFTGNVADVRGPGYGFWLQGGVSGNVIACDNVVTAAGKGFATTTCTR